MGISTRLARSERAWRARKADCSQCARGCSNRSAALLKLKKVAKALEDADKCITLSPGFSKGHFRKGAILEEQGKHAPASAPAARAVLRVIR